LTDVKLYTIITIAILILHTVSTSIICENRDINVVTIYKNSVVWNYNINGSRVETIKRLSLYMDRLGFSYMRQSGLIKEGTRNTTRLTIVFIGNERMYYQFTYVSNNILLNIDSNIVINERSLTVQWINVESRIYRHQNINRTYHKFVFPKVTTLMCNSKNFTVSMSYASVDVNSLNNITFEELSVYDVSMNKALYYHYLGKCVYPEVARKSIYYLNATYIPMYAKIEISTTVNNDGESMSVAVHGLSSNDIYNAFKVLPSIIPMLNIVLDVVYQLGLVNEEFPSLKYVDFVDKTLDIVKTYANDKLVLRELIDYLKNKYNITDPQIEVGVNRTQNNISVYIELKEGSIANMTKSEVIQLLSELIGKLNSVDLGLLGVENAIHQAWIEDMRYSKIQTSTSSDMKRLITVSVLVLASAQVAILIGALFYVLKYWRRR